METPTRFILALAGSALVVAGLPAAAQANDVNTAPARSTAGSPAFDSGAQPFSVAVLPDGSQVVVGTVPDVGQKVASFRPDPGNPNQFLLDGSILGSDHFFGSAVGLAFDSAKRLWMADASGPNGPSINSYPAGFGPNIEVLAPRLSISGHYTGLVAPSEALLTKSGEVVVSDMAQNKVFIYPANTGGNIRPARYVQTSIGAPYGAALDSAGQIYVANYANSSITVYPANAGSTTAPIRLIQGSNTQLDGPRKIAVDTSNNIYVTNGNTESVVVFAAGATGNVAPVKRVIGAGTQLDNPMGIALDAARRVYVVNGINSGTGKVLVQFPTLMPYLKPTAVRSLKVSGGSKSSTRTISWTAPSNTGGTPIIKYRVLVKKGSTTLYNKTTTGRSYNLSRTRLENGTNTVTITAVNKIGDAPAVKKTFTVTK
jgi:streptogramin lyase